MSINNEVYLNLQLRQFLETYWLSMQTKMRCEISQYKIDKQKEKMMAKKRQNRMAPLEIFFHIYSL